VLFALAQSNSSASHLREDRRVSVPGREGWGGHKCPHCSCRFCRYRGSVPSKGDSFDESLGKNSRKEHCPCGTRPSGGRCTHQVTWRPRMGHRELRKCCSGAHGGQPVPFGDSAAPALEPRLHLPCIHSLVKTHDLFHYLFAAGKFAPNRSERTNRNSAFGCAKGSLSPWAPRRYWPRHAPGVRSDPGLIPTSPSARGRPGWSPDRERPRADTLTGYSHGKSGYVARLVWARRPLPGLLPPPRHPGKTPEST